MTLIHKLLGYAALIVFLALISFASIWTFDHLQMPQFTNDEVDWGLMDFQNTVYYPVSAFLSGVNPYDFEEYSKTYPVDASFPLYSPLILVLHAPLGALSFETANVVYFFFNSILFVILALLLFIVCERKMSLWSVVTVAILMIVSRPGWMVLLCGQIVCQVTIGTILALHYSGSRPFRAGLGLALACLKPTFGVPLALMLLFRGHVRTVVIGACISVGSALIVITAMPGVDNGVVEFMRVIWSQHVTADNLLGVPDPSYHMRIDSMSVIARIFSWNPGTVEMALVFVVMTAIFGIIISRMRSYDDEHRACSLTSILIGMVILCSIYHMEYDALILFLVAASLMTKSRSNFQDVSPRLWAATLGLTIVFLWNPLTTKFARSSLEMSDRAIAHVGTADGALLLLVLLVCGYVALKLRPRNLGSSDAEANVTAGTTG